MLKHITEELVQSGRFRDSLYFARQGLGAYATIKWTVYVSILSFRYFFWGIIGKLSNK